MKCVFGMARVSGSLGIQCLASSQSVRLQTLHHWPGTVSMDCGIVAVGTKAPSYAQTCTIAQCTYPLSHPVSRPILAHFSSYFFPLGSQRIQLLSSGPNSNWAGIETRRWESGGGSEDWIAGWKKSCWLTPGGWGPLRLKRRPDEFGLASSNHVAWHLAVRR